MAMAKRIKLDYDENNMDELDRTTTNATPLPALGTFKKYHFNHVPHMLLPSFNNFPNERTEYCLEDEPTFKIEPPLSVFVAGDCIPSIDLCHKRTIDLDHYMVQLKRLRMFYISSTKKSKVQRKAEKKNIYPASLLRFIEKVEQHPDPYFNARYDSYFTGGNLAVLPGDNYIVHASGEHLDSITLSKFKTCDEETILDPRASRCLNKTNNSRNEIFEIQPFSYYSPNTFTTRCQNKISIHCCTSRRIKELYNFESKVPFISFAQNKCDLNIFITTDLNQEINIWDLQTSKKSCSKIDFNRKKAIDRNWNSIKAYSRHTYIYAGLNEFCLWDVRAPIYEIKQNFCTFDDKYQQCAMISSIAISDFQNIFYFGSTHKLQCLDVRFMKKEYNNDKNMVLQWTHQMESPPLMIVTRRGDENCEQIFLGSARAGDIRVCTNYQNEIKDLDSDEKEKIPKRRNDFIYFSNCLPFMPPTNMDCYKQSRIRGKCLNPALNIKERVNRCNTGLSIYQKDKKVFLLTANSIADIFAHKITNSTTKEVPSTEIMEQYENNINNSRQTQIKHLTTVADLSGMSKFFLSNNVTNNHEPFPKIELANVKRMGRWQKTIQNLYTYKDALASDILAIWEMDLPIKMENSCAEDTQSNTNLVSNWLNNQSSTILHESLNMSMPTNDNSFKNNSIGGYLSLNDANNSISVNQTNLNLSLPMFSSKPNVRSKLKYVKGF